MLCGLWQANCGFLTARAVVPRILRNEHRLQAWGQPVLSFSLQGESLEIYYNFFLINWPQHLSLLSLSLPIFFCPQKISSRCLAVFKTYIFLRKKLTILMFPTSVTKPHTESKNQTTRTRGLFSYQAQPKRTYKYIWPCVGMHMHIF